MQGRTAIPPLRMTVKRLMQQRFEQPIHPPHGLAHPPSHEVPEWERLDVSIRLDNRPRHHARKADRGR